jgi:hypothetical protein
MATPDGSAATTPDRAAPPGATRARLITYAVVLVAAAVPRAWLAVADQGIFWPDEIFQSLEQAHRFAFGYGYVPWEYQEGARSWVFAGFLGLWLKLLSLLGASSAPTLVVATKLLMVALGLAAILGAMRLAERLAGLPAALLAGALLAAFPPALVFGGRCLSESASAPLVVFAALVALSPGRRAALFAGGLIGLAVLVRYQNGLLAAGLLLLLLARRRWRDALWCAVAGMGVGLAGGLLDWATWGAPFHSLRVYVRFNLIEGKSAEYGVDPFGYYGRVAWTATGPVLVVILIGLAASARRELGLLLLVAGFVLAHSLIAHKELRFLMPVAPLALALAGAGIGPLVERAVAALASRGAGDAVPSARAGRTRRERRTRGRRAVPLAASAVAEPAAAAPTRHHATIAVWALAALLAWGLALRARGLTFEAMGQPRGFSSGARSVWRANDAVNRLLWAAGAAPDLCGLLLVGHPEIWTGGHGYLHRDVTIFPVTGGALRHDPSLGPAAAIGNYAITPRAVSLPPGFRVVRAIAEMTLWRRDGACSPPPADYTRLFPK